LHGVTVIQPLRRLICTISGENAGAELQVWVCGQQSLETAPSFVSETAKKLSDGQIKSLSFFQTAAGPHLVLQVDDVKKKPWLSGGENWRLVGNAIAEAVRSNGLSSARVLLDETSQAQFVAEVCCMYQACCLRGTTGCGAG